MGLLKTKMLFITLQLDNRVKIGIFLTLGSGQAGVWHGELVKI